ncbi:MAG: agmatine deiminase family protein [Myxococcota bacterium]
MNREWGPYFGDAQREVAAFARALVEQGGEELQLVVLDAESETEAAGALDVPVTFHRLTFGDIWLRDIAPVFVSRGGELGALCFRFNGWGNRYHFAGDDELAGRIASRVGATPFSFDWVLEGGAVEHDGRGTLLTTEQCLLHPNRNSGTAPARSKAQIGRELCDAYGADTVIWLGEGLRNDHTDGHVDTLARFIAPSVVLCMEPAENDPNREALLAVMATLRSARDAHGKRLEVVTVPSPGAVLDDDGDPMPASYANFYIANRCVVVPTYGSPADERALRAFEGLFPKRQVLGLSARAILTGGGAFHCISQQQPSL